MTTSSIQNQIKKLKSKVIEAIQAENIEAKEAAFAMLKKHYPEIAVTFEAELKAQEAAKVAAELKAQEEVLAKAKAEMQELTLTEVVKQNAALKDKLEELSQLFHRFSDAAMKNDVKHEQIIAEHYSQIQEGRCSGSDGGFHSDVD